QGCVLSPFSLYTNYCTSGDPSVKLLKFVDDTSVIGLIRDDDESAYRREVEQLALWCGHNNLELNTLRTVEMTLDFRKSPPRAPKPSPRGKYPYTYIATNPPTSPAHPYRHIESNEILNILLPGHLLQRIQGLPSGCIHFLNMFETCLPLFGQSSSLGLLCTFTCSTAAILKGEYCPKLMTWAHHFTMQSPQDFAGLFCDSCGQNFLNLRELFQKIAIKSCCVFLPVCCEEIAGVSESCDKKLQIF